MSRTVKTWTEEHAQFTFTDLAIPIEDGSRHLMLTGGMLHLMKRDSGWVKRHSRTTYRTIRKDGTVGDKEVTPQFAIGAGTAELERLVPEEYRRFR